MEKRYDIIVVGGGHAGCEAAVAAARMGSSVLLITMDMTAFAKMSCNPAVGVIAKGQIVRESGDVESSRTVRQNPVFGNLAKNPREHPSVKDLCRFGHFFPL